MKYIILLFLTLLSFAVHAQTITTIVGGGSLGDGDSAVLAGLTRPIQIWFDTSNNMYFAEDGPYKIRKVVNGIISTFAGTGSTGFSGDGGPATNATFGMYSPTGVVGDRMGNIYITDYGNNVVHVVNSAGIINRFAGNGTGGWAGDGYPATAAEIGAPFGICIDTVGNIYFNDGGCIGVRRVSPSGIITTVAGDGAIYPFFGGDGGPATAALFYGTEGVAVDYAGNLYIADRENNRIRKVTTDGIVNTIAGCSSTGYFSGDGGPATLARLNNPQGIFVDNQTGNVYWTEVGNHVVRVLTPDGIVNTVVGVGGVGGFSGDDGPATAALLYKPGYVCLDNCGNLIISDTYNNRIRKVTYPFGGTLPSISVTTAHDTLCAGATAVFSSTLTAGSPGGLSYQWFVNGVAASTSSTYSYTPDNGDSVRCVLTYTNTCAGSILISSNTIHITVDSAVLPVISVSTATDTLCVGSTATISSTLTSGSTGSTSYQWIVNGSSTAGTSSTYSYVPDNNDSVRCIITYTNTCTGITLISSNTIHFTVDTTEVPTISLPAITYSVTGSVVTVNAVLAIVGTASPSYYINWYNHGIYFATTTAPTVTYTKTEPIDSITATIVPTGTPCYDTAQSNVDIIRDSTLATADLPAGGFRQGVLKIYPNPAGAAVTITAPCSLETLILSDIYGKQFITFQPGKQTTTLDISKLPPGMYFVHVNGFVAGRFVKN